MPTKNALVKKFKLDAHPYLLCDGEMATELNGYLGEATVEAESFAELDAHAMAFGRQHAPCNVLISCLSEPVPLGFDEWNNNMSAYVFGDDGEHIRFKDGYPMTPEEIAALDPATLPDPIDETDESLGKSVIITGTGPVNKRR